MWDLEYLFLFGVPDNGRYSVEVAGISISPREVAATLPVGGDLAALAWWRQGQGV